MKHDVDLREQEIVCEQAILYIKHDIFASAHDTCFHSADGLVRVLDD